MGLLDMCCPKKPKKSLDYVIEWVEDTDKIIKELSDTVQELNKWKEGISEETLKPIFDEYAETYPWDNVPAFNAKADKVENAVAGNIASLDSEGNLLDSGKKPSDFVPNVSGAIEGNLPQFDADGNIQDSGNKAEDFALAGHSHSAIIDASTESSISIDEGVITLTIEGEGSGVETQINADNIGNLHRALATPSSTPENDATKLITSKAVYDALAGKMGALKEIFIDCDDSGSDDAWEIKSDAAGEAAFRAALVWDDNAPRLVIINIRKGAFGTTNLKTYRTIGSIHATAVEANIDSYNLSAEIYVDGHVFTRTGQSYLQEETWSQGLTLEANDIFTHVSNS